MRPVLSFAVVVMLGIGIVVMQTEAADQNIALMLGGKFCESYPKEITDALMKVKGSREIGSSCVETHVDRACNCRQGDSRKPRRPISFLA